AARQRRRGLTELQVTEADIVDRPKRSRDRCQAVKPLESVMHAQVEYICDGQAADLDGQHLVVEAGAVTGRALDGDVRQVLNIEVDVPEAAAGRALPLAGVEREMAGLPPSAPGVVRRGEQAADVVERSGVGRRC